MTKQLVRFYWVACVAESKTNWPQQTMSALAAQHPPLSTSITTAALAPRHRGACHSCRWPEARVST